MKMNSSGISLTLCGQEPSPQARELGSMCWGLPDMPAPAQALCESIQTGSNQKI